MSELLGTSDTLPSPPGQPFFFVSQRTYIGISKKILHQFKFFNIKNQIMAGLIFRQRMW
jgi:hypothetical protein